MDPTGSMDTAEGDTEHPEARAAAEQRAEVEDDASDGQILKRGELSGRPAAGLF
jgi:hypothetical protein